MCRCCRRKYLFGAVLSFDAVTEIRFGSRAAMDAAMALPTTLPASERIACGGQTSSIARPRRWHCRGAQWPGLLIKGPPIVRADEAG